MMSDMYSLSSLFNGTSSYHSPYENYYSALESIDMNKSKNPNLIFFLDWDDTLLPSSILEDCGLFSPHVPIPDNILYCLKKCEEIVRQILLFVKSLTDHVYIITNSTNNWVSHSLNRFYPALEKDGAMNNIPIIYAREHEHVHSNPMIWKYRTMADILDRVIGPNVVNDEGKEDKEGKEDNEGKEDKEGKENKESNKSNEGDECNKGNEGKENKKGKIKVVSIGDSTFERNALHQIGIERNSITTKIIKMLEFPDTIDHLYTQLFALTDVLGPIMMNIDPCDLMTCVDTIGNNTLIKIIQNNSACKSIELLDKNIFKDDHFNWFDEPPINISDNSPGLHGWHFKWADHWKSHYEQKTLEANNIKNDNNMQTEANHNTVETFQCVFSDRYGLDMIDEREKRECAFDDSDLDQIILDLQSIDLNSDIEDTV